LGMAGYGVGLPRSGACLGVPWGGQRPGYAETYQLSSVSRGASVHGGLFRPPVEFRGSDKRSWAGGNSRRVH
jgi:hypothetical protein